MLRQLLKGCACPCGPCRLSAHCLADLSILVLCCVQVGLRGINGLYLFEIEHADGSTAKVVDHDTVLREGDVLWFAGEQMARLSRGLCRHSGRRLSQDKTQFGAQCLLCWATFKARACTQTACRTYITPRCRRP